jgi:hypothetical protein
MHRHARGKLGLAQPLGALGARAELALVALDREALGRAQLVPHRVHVRERARSEFLLPFEVLVKGEGCGAACRSIGRWVHNGPAS